MQSYETILKAKELEFREPDSPPSLPEAHLSDPYWQAAMAAWRRVAACPCLPGTMRWLEAADPDLYRRLLEDLPAQIDCLWDRRAALAEFQRILDAWVGIHGQACGLYERDQNRLTVRR